MKITLMHNPDAGDGDHSREKLISKIEKAGHQVRYQSLDIDEQLPADPGDLVVAAGGDGAVEKVARALLGREVPFTILPLGTANNIARALGLDRSVSKLIAGWESAPCHPLDIGVVRGLGEEEIFIETAGVGFIAQMMPVLSALGKVQSYENPKEKIKDQLQFYHSLLSQCQARSWEARIDDRDISDPSLLIEVMNISTVGPGLQLASEASPHDGYLDIVIAREEHRDPLSRLLNGKMQNSDSVPFEVHRARRMELKWDGSELHLDSDIWAGTNRLLKKVTCLSYSAPTTLEIRVEPGALKLLAPIK